MNLKEILERKKQNRIEEIEEFISNLPPYNEEIFISLSILYLKTSLSYTDWRFLLSSFTSLPYIKPKEKTLNSKLMELIVIKKGFSHAKFKSYFIESHFTKEIQSKILKKILGEKILD